MGVQVRVGDKLNNNFYDQWSLRDLYFKKAMSLFIQKYEDFDLHFIFFVGEWYFFFFFKKEYHRVLRKSKMNNDRWWIYRISNRQRPRMGFQTSHR